MANFTPTFLAFIAIAISNLLAVQAAPWPIHSRHATHRVRHVGRSQLTISTYHPKTTFKTFGANGIAQKAPTVNSLITTPAINESAFSFMETELGLDPSKVGYRSGLIDGKSKFAYVRQTHDGVPFVNAVANIAWNNGKVVSYGSSFVNTTKIADSKPSRSLASILPSIEEQLGGNFNNHTPTVEYLAREDGSVSLVHVVQIRNETEGTWFEAYACAHTEKLLSVTDFVAHASYTVLPITKQIFDEGVETLTDPQDLKASPFGWHSDGKDTTNETLGNNAAAFISTGGRGAAPVTAQETSANQNFNTEYDDSFDPTRQSNIQASLTNAFYIANTVHDIAYRYGFTEKTFNFQDSNFGNGGAEGDSVLVSVQDASGLNNANFATPPDGQSGVCRMFIWDLTNPRRDGAMENDIIVHEMTHGITSRMTGGGSGRCLQTVEAGGMGEGWSDAMAEWVQQKSATVKDFVVGQYVTDNAKGIRTAPYSTNAKTNPLTFADVARLNEVHAIGEIWANMLHNVYAELVAERGFSNQALTNPDTDEGNVVYMHLFMDALLLQPCNPTFIDARDAWIQADENRFNGANKCTLFKAFASRGLGLNAAADFKNNFDVPAGC